MASRTLARRGLAFYDICMGRRSLTDCEFGSSRSGIVVRSAQSAELDEIGRLRRAAMAHRLDAYQSMGSECLVASRNDELVAYAWTNPAVFAFLGKALWQLPPGTICLHDVFIWPRHRANKVFNGFVAEIFRLRSAAGYRAIYCVVDRANMPALTGFQRLGMRFRRTPIIKLPGLLPIHLAVGSVIGDDR
jgi:hypothetical protein